VDDTIDEAKSPTYDPAQGIWGYNAQSPAFHNLCYCSAGTTDSTTRAKWQAALREDWLADYEEALRCGNHPTPFPQIVRCDLLSVSSATRSMVQQPTLPFDPVTIKYTFTLQLVGDRRWGQRLDHPLHITLVTGDITVCETQYHWNGSLLNRPANAALPAVTSGKYQPIKDHATTSALNRHHGRQFPFSPLGQLACAVPKAAEDQEFLAWLRELPPRTVKAMPSSCAVEKASSAVFKVPAWRTDASIQCEFRFPEGWLARPVIEFDDIAGTVTCEALVPPSINPQAVHVVIIQKGGKDELASTPFTFYELCKGAPNHTVLEKVRCSQK
jgi:hypothetical protein